MFKSFDLHESDPADYSLEDQDQDFKVRKQHNESPRVLSCLNAFCKNCLTNNLNDTNDASKTDSIVCPDCKETTTAVSLHYDYLVTDNFDLNAVEPRSDVEERMRGEIEKLLVNAEIKVEKAIRNLSISLTDLQSQLYCVREEIENNSHSFKRILDICRENAYKVLENLHSAHELKISDLLLDVEKSVEKIENACESTKTVLNQTNGTELLNLKKIIGTQIINLIKHVPQVNVDFSLDIDSSHDKFNIWDQDTLGTFRTKLTVVPKANKSPSTLSPVLGESNDNSLTGSVMPMQRQTVSTISEAMAKMFQNTNGNVPGNSFMQRRPTAGMDNVSMSPSAAIVPIGTMPLTLTDDMGLTMNDRINGPSRLPMQIRYKFGSLGASSEQFDSPHGFCMGVEEEIIVADTNNHRIGVFEKYGSLKFHFGVPGKEQGQLWHPRKVAVMQTNGNFVVCDRGYERSRMQIFTKEGHFIKQIAIKFIDIVACLAVTNQGRIVVLDSVVPTVFFISEDGELLHWFDCCDYIKEPSDVAISGSDLYICDFKGHSVAVFTEDGKFQHRIGHEKITQYPNGIGISDAGDVLIGDSHGNRFHIACYSRDGILCSEFICPYVKVSRCCGLKITSDGYIVTLAKNNHHVLVLYKRHHKFGAQQSMNGFLNQGIDL